MQADRPAGDPRGEVSDGTATGKRGSRWAGPGAAGPAHLADVNAPRLRTHPHLCSTCVTFTLFLSHVSHVRGPCVTPDAQALPSLHSPSFTWHRLCVSRLGDAPAL
ncbi:hypothetical protein GCM10022403_068110 [Streptomyces coacervatus]|uniref:Uncharacterized protein n=1 Tax=Streptomyces coacervatus TaxID=647381 RepID=A0ABP7IS58_9ACTN